MAIQKIIGKNKQMYNWKPIAYLIPNQIKMKIKFITLVVLVVVVVIALNFVILIP